MHSSSFAGGGDGSARRGTMESCCEFCKGAKETRRFGLRFHQVETEVTTTRGVRRIKLASMRRIQIIIGACAFILIIALIVWMAGLQRNQAGLGKREIADALVGFHHRWETNNYRSPGTGVPQALERPSICASSAGMLGAYVQYKHTLLGLEWSKRYHILRTSTNDPVWTLYEFEQLERPRARWCGWKRQMLTVTNSF